MSKHSNREKEVMLWVSKNYKDARVWRFDNGQAYAKFSIRDALQEYKATKSITMAMKKCITINYGNKGWPDLLLIYYSIAVGIEIKVGKDRQREDQENMENTFRMLGSPYILLNDRSSIEGQLAPTLISIETTMEPLWIR